ncbi:MAG: TspO/MBR family protein [Pseudomonadota bacterium]
MTEYLDAIIIAGAVFAAAATGGIFAPGEWYDRLDKPSWTPPDWAFPVVWTVLYIMIAIAGWLVWRADGFGLAFAFWIVQLVFNAAWSAIMFGFKAIRVALYDAFAMAVSIIAFMVLAWPISPTATYLFVPYLAWVATAIALNYAVLKRNPQAT